MQRCPALVAAFLLGAVATAHAVGAGPEGASPPARAPRLPASFGPEAQGQSEAARHRQIDDLRRQDLAAALARLGDVVRWQDYSLRQLTERRARAEAAAALRAELGVTVDWQALTLEELLDLRVRGAKAAELANVFGVSVDWQRYSWIELEALLRTLRRMGSRARPGAPNAAEASTGPEPGGPLLAPTFDRPVERRGGRVDPDGVLAPTFAPRSAGRAAERDPDAVIRPRFVPRTASSNDERDPDAVIRPRFAGRPVVHSGGGPDDLISPTFAETRTDGEPTFAPALDDPDELIGPGLAAPTR